MHISVRIPQLKPNELPTPTRCPGKHPKTKRQCSGTSFKLHQAHCRKAVRDLRHTYVTAQRYECLKCHHKFRVYPQGVSADQLTASLKALCVLLYMLGLSYQGVVDFLEALLHPVCKTTVYNQVQAAGKRVRQLHAAWRHAQRGKIKVMGLDFTHVKQNGQEQIVGVASAILSGEPIAIELLESEGSVRVLQWIREIVEEIGAEILVTDDADALKIVADELECQQQICRAHVNRNVHDLVAALGTKALDHPDRVPWELPGMTVEQFLEDLQDLEWIIKSVPHDGQYQLDQLAARYQLAPPPPQDHRATMWYRMRLLTLNWSEDWRRLAFYLAWRGDNNAKLDGTNNVTEQIIGNSIKERYRPMRGYKCKESIRNVSSLIAWVRMQGPDYDLGHVVNS
jgi:transposase-like protein